MENISNTILIIDDVEMNRDILQLQFVKEYNTVCCSNGLEGLNYVKEHGEHIVAVLLDIVMPVMTGTEFLEQIRRLNLIPNVPIFVITAENDESKQLDSFDYGITDIISKPFNTKFLCKRVESQIDLYLTRRSLEYTNYKQSITIANQAKEIAKVSTNIIATLAVAIEFRSGETGKHINSIKRLTYNALNLMRKNRFTGCEFLSDKQISDITYASVLHDIGKIAVPDSILNKPGRLTPEEFDVIKSHTLSGCEIIDRIGYKDNMVLRYAYDICRHHHERWDGNGYPDKLKGNEISIWAQLISIIDVYDALTQERCYKTAFSKEKALSMIENKECGIFNPELVDFFIANIDEITRDNQAEIDNL